MSDLTATVWLAALGISANIVTIFALAWAAAFAVACFVFARRWRVATRAERRRERYTEAVRAELAHANAQHDLHLSAGVSEHPACDLCRAWRQVIAEVEW